MGYVVEGSNPAANFTPAPPGVHQAVLAEVVPPLSEACPWGQKPGEPMVEGGQERRKIRLIFQINEADLDTGRQHEIHYAVTDKLGKNKAGVPSNFRKVVGDLLGKQLSDDEAAQPLDTDTLLGRNCQLQIEHMSSADGTRTYANVASSMSCPKGMPLLKVSPDYVTAEKRWEKRQQGQGEAVTPGAPSRVVPSPLAAVEELEDPFADA